MLMRGPEDRKALRCRLPGPPMAFAAQRVREEAEDAEKVEFLGWKGGGKGGKNMMEVILRYAVAGSIPIFPQSCSNS